MKKFALLSALVFIGISTSFSQISIDDAQLFGSSRAFFAPVSFNAGLIADSTYSHAFTFKNTSQGDIQLIGAITPEGVAVMYTDRFVSPDEEVIFYTTLNRAYLENFKNQSSFAIKFDLFFQETNSVGIPNFNKAAYVIKGEFH
ncbi:MAG: hypothetical protein JXR68_11825 [Bacteroidales bacterium]|nr:hypothetical protein [Bacteroidales bacterium]